MARVPVRAHQTGGNQGRTVKITVGDCLVTVRVAGQPAVTLLEGRTRSTGGGGGSPTRVPSISRLSAPQSAVRAVRGPRAAFGMGA